MARIKKRITTTARLPRKGVLAGGVGKLAVGIDKLAVGIDKLAVDIDKPATFPGRLEVQLGERPANLPNGKLLAAETLVAALLEIGELRPHVYIAHRASQGTLVTVLAYVKTADLARGTGAALRIPQQGAWLSCPTDGQVSIVGSGAPLGRDQIAKLLAGSATHASRRYALPPRKGGDDNVKPIARPISPRMRSSG